MKKLKIFLFVISLFFLGIVFVQAGTITTQITVGIITGTLTATNCTIPAGASTCNDINLTWTTTNAISTSAVTTDYPSANSIAGSGNTGTDVDYTIPHGPRTFYLYNNSNLLKTVNVTASCVAGADWDKTEKKCVVTSKINPDLKVTLDGSAYVVADKSDGPLVVSYNSVFNLNWGKVDNATSCTLDGVTVNTGPGSIDKRAIDWWTNNSHNFVFSCKDVNGVILGTDTLKLSYPPMQTNLKTSCSADGKSATLTWTNPVGYNMVYTRAYPGTYREPVLYEDYIVYGDDETGTSFSFDVTPGNNYTAWVHTRGENKAYSRGLFPDGLVVNCPAPAPTCSDGIKNQNETGIDTGGVCALPPVLATISATDCTIPAGASTCNDINLTWTTTNAISTSAVTTDYPSANSIAGSGNTGTDVDYTIPHGPRTFYLYNNSNPLKTVNVTASCVAGTDWSKTEKKCVPTGGKTDGYWSEWIPVLSTCPSKSITQRRIYTPATNGGDDNQKDEPSERTVNSSDCPTVKVTVQQNNKVVSSKISYNSKVNVNWISSKATSCSCASKDVSKNGTCDPVPVTNTTNPETPYISLALKKNITYTVTCNSSSGITASDYVKVLVDDINTNYIEN